MNTIAPFRRSSSFVMASVFSLSLAAVIGLVVYLIIIISDQALLEESEAAIDADLRMFKESAALNGMDYVKRILTHRLNDGSNTNFYALKNPQGEVILSNIKIWPKEVDVLNEGVIQFEVPHEMLDMPGKDKYSMSFHYDVMAKMYLYDDGHVILVGRDIDEIEIRQWVTQAFGSLVILIALLLAVGFFLIGRFVVGKVNIISHTANEIVETGNISQRIDTGSNWDDLSKLGEVLNRMLDEIEASIMTTKRVTDNIAHDLRTPLTRLRTDLESVKDEVQRAELLKEADSLLDMFNGLLRIAEIETEHQKSAFTVIDLAEIAEDAEAFYVPLADAKNITIYTDIAPCHMVGDRSLLFQAFANIIDNAIKFTPKGKDIHIRLQQTDGAITFSVKDAGPGIPEEKQDKVFRRFYRLDKSRSQPGHGLGLSIVKAIADLHEGEIRLINEAVGMIFEITFSV